MPAARSAAVSLFCLLGGLAFAAGCQSPGSSAAPVGRTYPAYPKDHPVDVYVNSGSEAQLLEGFGLTYEPAQLPPDATMIGRIDVERRSTSSEVGSWRAVATEVRRQARRLGTDAVLIDSYNSRVGLDRHNWSNHLYRSLAARAYRYAAPRTGATP